MLINQVEEHNPIESYEIRWYNDGEEKVELRDLLEIEAGDGKWEVKVKFTTDEIWKDTRQLASASKRFSVTC
jgi:hypothetical protein